MTSHSSDCALNNAPALPVGPCSCDTMNLREELERLDDAVITGASYGFDQSIWRRMIGVLDQVDALGLAIAEAGYTWTPAMRSAYERATETASPTRPADAPPNAQCSQRSSK